MFDDFAPLRIREVVHETSDAVSLVLDVPPDQAERFRYRAGQFLTLQVDLDGRRHRRCYSMSSAPHTGKLQITVKRDPGGLVSNWLNDTAAIGGLLYAAPPQGRFVLGESERDIVAFAAGSGITPVFSLVDAALAESARNVRLFYANRSRQSVIFARALAELADRHPDRLTLTHHFDEVSGVVDPAVVESFLDSGRDRFDADYYICGPGPFMDLVEKSVLAAGVPPARLHLERFEAPPGDTGDAATTSAATQEVVIELDRRTTTVRYRAGDTILQCVRTAGLRAPYSCEIGSCGTCIARIVEGSARMVNNDVLDDDEVAAGYVVTCQALPTSPTVRVVYE
ncbi:3-ketosteroid-9-alpha-hydroxylase reductase subunit [Mycolicibacterium hassiacum DSM 44199]|jgi:ferredoxin-NADP reductase|uniref:3-ketosteroid-9-alpha-hydroxylase reductase subunit n=1 Tax=Mycolicibacterium hassiacum (strain DSM 44199 / CIP 105218 / JCM 12690 / 3849) TaxID=1122247 RepID=K5BKW8_MYCHD|nr:ferredoxin--NADP reductase [Mycolicibacterium hassiacum]EKF25589.1 3-ketosteroid-9-alpha-hydroxylase reductase subunit [Mycolicibacterium hassiacum DSM 44199]MBX5485148.1 ferredoxin--NADP reductase [Mycolicibacterium hassiacum]MDA4084509.1 ferredoxin [Mycolicibacterium hassiacum DSM 44199]PZN24007.1 MAG: ferredoxin [Mycolicibacterium hassiacum]VCT90864.1 3-ketosteroid-9-alpha-monooxygenase, ferredoxin reductase component [Mycolicibacterium hassiacum DSM 44199]